MRQLHLVVVLGLVLTGVKGQLGAMQQTCPARGGQATIQMNADAFIGGLVSMHGQGGGGYGCGQISLFEMQAYEAIRWALDRLNKKGEVLNGEYLDDTYIPGVKIGMVALDYCDTTSLAVTRAQDLFPQFSANARSCSAAPGLMLGLTGASSSSVTKEFNTEYATDLNIPLVSYMATAQTLTQDHQFPNFMRTVSPDGKLMDAIVKVMQEINWKFVVVVYTENTYGRGSLDELRPRLAAAGICLTLAVGTSSSDASTATMQNVLDRVLETGTTGVVYLGNSKVASGLLEAAESYSSSGKLQWIFTDSIPLSYTFAGKKYPRGIISVLAGSRKIIEFEDHWVRINIQNTSSENPWFKDWYMAINQCDLQGYNVYNNPCAVKSESQRRAEFVQDQFVEPAVHAVYAYAYALKQAHTTICGGQTGVCSALKDLSLTSFHNDYLQKVNFTYTKVERVESLASFGLEPYNAPAKVAFDANGDIISPSYDVYNFNNYPGGSSYKFVKLGSYLNERLEIVTNKLRMYDQSRDNVIATPSSLCPSTGCFPCLGTPIDQKYMYSPGDIILTGVFPVHQQGAMPMTCGVINNYVRSGIQYLEAMFYAINRVSLVPNILPGVRLGGLGLDDCGSDTLGSYYVGSIQSGELTIEDTSGEELAPNTVEGYTGAYSTEATIPLADFMHEVRRPLLGYAATSAELETNPYYIYMSYNNRLYVKAMIYFLKRAGWNFVQALQSGSDYSQNGIELFKEMAAEEGICVVSTLELGGDTDAEEVAHKLLSKPLVQPVVSILAEPQLLQVLRELKNKNASSHFVFLAPLMSGNDVPLYNAEEKDLLRTVIGLDPKRPDMNQFWSYLSGLNPTTHTSNPWFAEWYEGQHNCSLDANNMRTYGTICASNQPISSGPHFMRNVDAFTVIYGVFAFAYGLHETLKEFCGGSYNGVCANFRTAGNKGLVLTQKIKASSFALDGVNLDFVEGNADFPLAYIQSNGNTFVEVGSFAYQSKQYSVNLPLIQLPGYSDTSKVVPQCSMACTECMYMIGQFDHMYIPGDIIIPGLFDVHYPGDNIFTCGDVRLHHGFFNTEVFAFALDFVNRGLADFTLSNVTLGGLLFDGCMNRLRGNTITSALYSGHLLQDDGVPMYPMERMIGYMSYDSATTIDVAEYMSKYGLPIVSPGATSPVLDDKSYFSTFFRTIPTDRDTVRAMAMTAAELQFHYIITLNAPDQASRDALETFRKYAKELGICIGDSYEFETDGPIKTLVEYIRGSSTRVVAVFADPDRYVSELLDEKSKDVQVSNIVFLSNRHWNSPIFGPDMRKNAFAALTFGLDVPPMQLFYDFIRSRSPWANTGNPWLDKAFEKLRGCHMDGFDTQYQRICSPSQDMTFNENDNLLDYMTLPTTHAVLALAKAIHLTLIDLCGANYNGVCGNFVNDVNTPGLIMSHMDKLSVTDPRNDIFKFINRETTNEISVNLMNANGAPELIGQFSRSSNSVVYVKTTAAELRENYYKNIPATCVGDCAQCFDLQDFAKDFTYYSGDILFIGLFNARKSGNTPYSCGDINDKYGFQLVEAFHFALEYANSRTGIFKDLRPNVLYGGLALDVCQNPTRAGNLVANLHNGNIELVKNGLKINPNRVDAYIGPLESETTVRVADVLNALGIPQISYGATSLELMDPLKYKYFLRTVPADDKQARAIISYLKMFDLMNVQVIRQYSSIGEYAEQEFQRLAILNRVCVSQNITLGTEGTISESEAEAGLLKLTQKMDAKVVILFVDDPEPLIKVINKTVEINSHFYFIGTDKLGFDHEKWANATNLMNSRKAITFDIETADVPEFDRYLDNKNPDNYDFNPWFDDFYQMIFKCDLVGQSKYGVQCPANKKRGISRSDFYNQDPYVLYVVNAVFSAVLATDRTIKQMCQHSTMNLCNLFSTSGERREMILQNMKQVSFQDATMQPFYYTAKGESSRGYHIWEPVKQADGSNFILENVGSYNDTHYLKIDIRYDVKWTSICELAGSCQCEFPEYKPSRYMTTPSDYNLYLTYVSGIHKQDPLNPYSCGAIDTSGNFQGLMAFFYAISLVNADPRMPASLNLGGVALDTCSRPNRIGQDIYSLLSGNAICGAESAGQVIAPADIVAFMARNSDNAIATSSIVSPLKFTTLSPSATSTELSDKNFHPYFLRTVPPDNVQAIVISQVLESFGWDYVSLVYTDNAYGNAAMLTLLQNVQDTSTCVSQKLALPADATLDDAKGVVDLLSQKIGARVVILFVNTDHARLLLQATTDRGLIHRFVWVGSDTWANSGHVVAGLEDAAAGAITIQIRSEIVESFRTYIKSLNFTNRLNLPKDWFEDLYQTLHQCRILNSVVQKDFNAICSGEEVLTDAMIPEDPFTLHTIISVYMIASGLNSIEQCKGLQLSIAACLSLQQTAKDLIYQGVLGSQYTVLPEDLGDNSFNFRFTETGYGDIGYNILNFQKDGVTGHYVYTRIGTYREELSLDKTLYKGYNFVDTGAYPVSACPSGITCRCEDSEGNIRNQIRETAKEGMSYYQVSQGTYVDANTGEVVEAKNISDIADRFRDIWGIIVATFAGIGVIASLCMFIYLLVMYPVRGGTSVLGYMLSFGIILMFAMVFAFIVHATEAVCGIRQFCLGMVYAICYSAMFVKLVDAWRSNGKREIYEVKYEKLGHPLGLFFSAILLVLVQVIINAEWMILEPPAVTTILYKDLGLIWPRCVPDDFYDESLVLSLVYIMVLVALCLIFGILAWSNEKNHRESRWILGIAVLSAPVWVVFCVVATLGDHKMKDAAVAIGLLLNASIMLALGPMRKLYLLSQYEAKIEEEERQSSMGSQKGGDYASMYGRQYDNVGRLHDNDSMRGSVVDRGSLQPYMQHNGSHYGHSQR